MSLPSQRTYVLVAVSLAIGTAIAVAATFIFWGVLETIGRFDAPADMGPATRTLAIAAAVAVVLVLLSRVWKKEHRSLPSAMLLGVGAGMILDAAIYFALPN